MDAEGLKDGVLKAVEGVSLVALGVEVTGDCDVYDASGGDVWW